MANECELKLALLRACSAEQVDTALRSSIGVGLARRVFLLNRYFDTPNFHLNEKCIALRIREFDERGVRHGVQTLKTKGQARAGLHQRGEWEWSLRATETGVFALDQAALLANASWDPEIPVDQLLEVFSTDFERSLFMVNNQEAELEIAVDVGRIAVPQSSDLAKGAEPQAHLRCNQAPLGELPINELELELKRGQPDILFNLAEALASYLPLVPFDTSKAERGYDLFHRHIAADVSARAGENSSAVTLASWRQPEVLIAPHGPLSPEHLATALDGLSSTMQSLSELEYSPVLPASSSFHSRVSRQLDYLVDLLSWLNRAERGLGFDSQFVHDLVEIQSTLDQARKRLGALAPNEVGADGLWRVVVSPLLNHNEWGRISIKIAKRLWNFQSS